MTNPARCGAETRQRIAALRAPLASCCRPIFLIGAARNDLTFPWSLDRVLRAKMAGPLQLGANGFNLVHSPRLLISAPFD